MEHKNGSDAHARVIQVIESTVCRGKGTADDVMRTVYVYRTFDGEFLAERDPCAP